MSRLSTDPIASLQPMRDVADAMLMPTLIIVAVGVCALAFRWWVNRRFPAEEVAGGLPHYVATRGADEERIMADIVVHPDAETPAQWATRHQAEGWTVRKENK